MFADVRVEVDGDPIKLKSNCSITDNGFNLPYSEYYRFWPGLTEIGPLLWQAKQTMAALCQLQDAT